MKKKLVALLLSAAMCTSAMAGLVACGGDDKSGEEEVKLEGTFDITVWCSEVAGVKELTEAQIAAFNESQTAYTFNATVEGISEANAATQMLQDVSSGADIYFFAQDQTARLIQAQALNRLPPQAVEFITSTNDSGVTNGVKAGQYYYAYPATADNGYFMYYDKSVIPAEHLGSLEQIISDCENASGGTQYFSFELEGSMWYAASFFFATGCHSNWTPDDQGRFTAVDDTINSSAGVIGARGMQKLLKSPAYKNSSKASDFGLGTLRSAVVVSGTWDKETAVEKLGDNFGVAELPSFTVDNQKYHLGSFSGNKLVGVKPDSDAAKVYGLHQLAMFLTNEASQLERFEAKGWGPSNINAQQNTAVQADVTLKALAAQNAYAIPESKYGAHFWSAGTDLVTKLKGYALDDTDSISSALQTYADAIQEDLYTGE